MKITVIKCLLLLLLASLCQWCTPKKNDIDITGVWRTLSNDTYMEIIISPKRFHSIHGKSGNNLWLSKSLFYYSPEDLLETSLWDCQLKNDSLLLFNDGAQINVFKVTAIGDDEMKLALDTIEFQLSRISDKDVMSEILKIDTLSWSDPHFKNYLQGYYYRRDLMKVK
jgi:hypothetical protein